MSDTIKVKCGKCGGTGRFALGMLNGHPYSNTGFDCWTCSGTGYVERKKRRTKAQIQQDKDNTVWTFVDDERNPHEYCKANPVVCQYCGEIHER